MTSMRVSGMAALVIGVIATVWFFTHKSAAFNSKPSAFVERFNQMVQDEAEQTGFELNKQHYCKERVCVYTGTYAFMTLNTRENGSVWRVAIRIVLPKGDDERKAYRLALVNSCVALCRQTSGLGRLDAAKLYGELIETLNKTLSFDYWSSKDVEGVTYFLDMSLPSPDAQAQVECGAADKAYTGE